MFQVYQVLSVEAKSLLDAMQAEELINAVCLQSLSRKDGKAPQKICDLILESILPVASL